MAVVGEKKNGQNERLTFERIPQLYTIHLCWDKATQIETLCHEDKGVKIICIGLC